MEHECKRVCCNFGNNIPTADDAGRVFIAGRGDKMSNFYSHTSREVRPQKDGVQDEQEQSK